jgi:Di-haem oxidoreductase, putative peroxidase
MDRRSTLIRHTTRFAAALIFTAAIAGPSLAQTDPGVRGGPPGAGGPITSRISPLSTEELYLFTEGMKRFNQLEAVCDVCSDGLLGADTGEDPRLATKSNSSGLGARFNGDQCTVCHSQPAIGGSGGFAVPNPQDPPNQQRAAENPMFSLIPHRKGGANRVPSFITQYGPIREARFVRKSDGSPDGGVHQLFTIVGRTDTQLTGCTQSLLPQPDFESEQRSDNVRFRIPTPLFGLGLVEAIQDSEILARHEATAPWRTRLGIQGIPNRSGNDGTITRFGWKAQNKSLTIFAVEAYNVEMGVTNDGFGQSTDETPECNGVNKNEFNDITRTDPDDSRNQSFYNPLHILPDWLEFAIFMRELAPPAPVAPSPSAERGKTLFGRADDPNVGCALCHTPQMVTPGALETAALANRKVDLYSDLLIHHMGAKLADGISQGAAAGDMFRTPPLWGVGQRRFFLHDGRTSDLLTAIQAHASALQGECDHGSATCYPPSEANAVIGRFNRLTTDDKQAIVDFLRSL